MSRGTIQRRGRKSWRLKSDIGTDANGKRVTRYETIRGTRQHAQRALTAALAALDGGTLVAKSNATIAEHMRAWLDGATDLAPKTRERYGELIERQIIPHLGAIPVQKLRPQQVEQWHATLLASGGAKGKPLSPRTVGHAHRVLHTALERAVASETLSRNVVSVTSPPKVRDDAEVQILEAGEIERVLDRLQGHPIHAIAALGLGSGMRRGELLALRWSDVDLDGASLKVERSLQETRDGLAFKTPKTKTSRRVISLPANVVSVLRAHLVAQLELRFALGLGKAAPDGLVFCRPDGAPLSPDNLSRDWRRVCRSRGLPLVRLHSWRHCHASALIAAGLDVVQIARRLGHKDVATTLRTYAHMFRRDDRAAADAMDAAMRAPRK